MSGFAPIDANGRIQGAGLRSFDGSGRSGEATLIAGTCVVPASTILATTRVVVMPMNTAGTAGHLSYQVNAGVGFTVVSTSGTDARTFHWFFIDPI